MRVTRLTPLTDPQNLIRIAVMLILMATTGSGFDASWWVETGLTLVGLLIAYLAIRRQVGAAVAANNAVARYVLRDLDETIAELGESHSELVAAISQDVSDQARLSLQSWRESALMLTGLLDGIGDAQAARDARTGAVAQKLRSGAEQAQYGINTLGHNGHSTVASQLSPFKSSIDAATAEVIELRGRLKAILARS